EMYVAIAHKRSIRRSSPGITFYLDAEAAKIPGRIASPAATGATRRRVVNWCTTSVRLCTCLTFLPDSSTLFFLEEISWPINMTTWRRNCRNIQGNGIEQVDGIKAW